MVDYVRQMLVLLFIPLCVHSSGPQQAPQEVIDALRGRLTEMEEVERRQWSLDLHALLLALPTPELQGQAMQRIQSWSDTLLKRLPDDSPFVQLRAIHADLPEIVVPKAAHHKNQVLLCTLVKAELQNALHSITISPESKAELRSQLNELSETLVSRLKSKTSSNEVVLLSAALIEQCKDDFVQATISPFSDYSRPLTSAEFTVVQSGLIQELDQATLSDIQNLPLPQSVVQKFHSLPAESARQYLILQLSQTSKERRRFYTDTVKALAPTLARFFRDLPAILNSKVNGIFRDHDNLVMESYKEWNENLSRNGEGYYKIWGQSSSRRGYPAKRVEPPPPIEERKAIDETGFPAKSEPRGRGKTDRSRGFPVWLYWLFLGTGCMAVVVFRRLRRA